MRNVQVLFFGFLVLASLPSQVGTRSTTGLCPSEWNGANGKVQNNRKCFSSLSSRGMQKTSGLQFEVERRKLK